MARIRAFTVEDLSSVAALRGRAFRYSRWKTTQDIERYFYKVFFEHPWLDPNMPSLVYEARGKVAGFLGIIPRPYRYGNTEIQGGITTQFMVAPEERGIAGTLLVRAAMSGPQELLVADVINEAAQRVWHPSGGYTARLFSMFWSCGLSPLVNAAEAELGASTAARRLQRLANPVLRRIDAFSASRSFQILEGSTRILSASIMNSFSERASEPTLRASFSEASLQWLLDRVCEKWPDASLTMQAVYDDKGDLAGWYIYLLDGTTARVLQMAGRRERTLLILEHMKQSASAGGAHKMVGRVEGRFMDSLPQIGAQYNYGGRGMMLHLKTPALLQHIVRGEALLSGLEGEWWMDF